MTFSPSRLRALLARAGYQSLDTPLVEPAALFLTKAGNQIIERLYTFEREGQQVALRPEFTASAAQRYVQQNRRDVARWQCYGAVFEAGNAQRMSAGAELIGAAGADADAEIMALAAHSLMDAGIGDWRLVVGHVGLTRCLLRRFGLDDRTERFLLRQRDTLHQHGIDAVLHTLDTYLAYDQNGNGTVSEGVVSASVVRVMTGGARGSTMGGRTAEDIAARLQQKQQRAAQRPQIVAALEFLETWGKIHAASADAFAAMEPFITDEESYRFYDQWRGTIELLREYELPETQVMLQPDLARSWDYYTGIVFELQTGDGMALGGGGRYDELIRLIGGENTPAVGFMLNVENITQLTGQDTEAEADALTISGEGSAWWAHRLRGRGFTVVQSTDNDTTLIAQRDTLTYQGQPYTRAEFAALINTLETSTLEKDTAR